MMNRDVMGRQMFANGGPAMPQPEMGMDQMAMMAQEQGVDPAQLQGALEMAQGQMQQIDNAENYEQVINGIRGDQQPLEARYAELTSVVGQEDSQATPESVLTLLQPVMQMAAVDQGIGGLAAEEMTAPIEGPMAEGIMSTVGMGEPDPVNFSQGGPVIHKAEGGQVQTLKDIYNARLPFFEEVYTKGDRAEALDDQKRMTKSQILFDIAQGGLALASPTGRNMSFAERLATSFNPVVGNIGARTAELEKFKRAQEAEERQIRLAALGSATTSFDQYLRNQPKPTVRKLTNEFAMNLINNDSFMEKYSKNAKYEDTGPFTKENVNFVNTYLTERGATADRKEIMLPDGKPAFKNIYKNSFPPDVLQAVTSRINKEGNGPTGEQFGLYAGRLESESEENPTNETKENPTNETKENPVQNPSVAAFAEIFDNSKIGKITGPPTMITASAGLFGLVLNLITDGGVDPVLSSNQGLIDKVKGPLKSLQIDVRTALQSQFSDDEGGVIRSNLAYKEYDPIINGLMPSLGNASQTMGRKASTLIGVMLTRKEEIKESLGNPAITKVKERKALEDQLIKIDSIVDRLTIMQNALDPDIMPSEDKVPEKLGKANPKIVTPLMSGKNIPEGYE
jgi:hypothetical protein